MREHHFMLLLCTILVAVSGAAAQTAPETIHVETGPRSEIPAVLSTDQFPVELIVYNVTRNGSIEKRLPAPVSRRTIQDITCGFVNVTTGDLIAPITLEQTERNTFFGTYAVPEEVEGGRFLCTITRANGEQAELTRNILRDPLIDLSTLLMALAGIAVVIGAVVLGWRKFSLSEETQRKRRMQTLQEKIAAIRESKEEIQKKYFRRTIDKESFTNLMEQYDERKTALEKELASLQERETADS